MNASNIYDRLTDINDDVYGAERRLRALLKETIKGTSEAEASEALKTIDAEIENLCQFLFDVTDKIEKLQEEL